LLIINEILADPDPIMGDSNRDGVINSDDDEFLELVNVSGQALDLSGWRISDAVRLRYTFPAGTSLKSGCGLVIFGGGDPKGDFGGSLVFIAGSLGLNNGGDLITVIDSEGVEVTAVLYGSEGNQDQSITRYPDLSGQLPLVLHSQAPEAGEALYSPGTRIDQLAFGSCP
jgi:type II secretory pathway component GspD/PulD (secretin)